MSEKHTILLVDDQPTLVKALRVLLRKDYRVLSAPNAAEAEAILEREDVHVVMSDQVMPGTSGIEFLHKVRERHPDAIRLLFTGDTDVRTVVDAVNEGSIHRYIIKPCDPRQLQSILREACERHDMIAERAQLLADLRQKNEQLERVNFELHQSDQLKNAFIEVASHELRTPLTILLGLARLAERVPGLSTMVMDLLRRMEQAGLRLQRLVDQLVALLSSDGIQRPLRRSPVALAELLQQAADDVRPFAEKRGQKLKQNWGDDLGILEIDRERLRDCLNHLLLNGIKFTPDGGTVALEARRTDDGVEIRVSDTGRGIDPASMGHMFQPFFTGFDVSSHSSGTFEFGRQGLGLGLSVVKAFVELHGGAVTCQSEPGKGSTFTIRLPAKVREAVGVGEGG